jgi:hypothetical protein
LKICFKDRSVISCFKNEPDILLTQVKILMEKTSRTRGDLALVISEISQENQESIRRIYNFAPAIQEISTKKQKLKIMEIISTKKRSKFLKKLVVMYA